MPNLLSSLETAKRALAAHRKAMDVTGHNTANAESIGYSRQRPILTATFRAQGSLAPGAPVSGTGVQVETVQRLRDQFADYQFRREQHQLGYWRSRTDNLGRVETAFAEPSDYSLQIALQEFWNAVEEVGQHPTSADYRVAAIQAGTALADTFQAISSRLIWIRENIGQEAERVVAEIERTAREIAAVNGKIERAVSRGQTPNDLLDTRDRLLDELSLFVDYRISDDGYQVNVAGRPLVSGPNFRHLELDTIGPELALHWQEVTGSSEPAAGRIAELIDAYNQVVPQYQTRLNELASGVIAAVNAVHQDGEGLSDSGTPPTGLDFFTGDSAENIAVNPDLMENPLLFAAAASGAGPGDGTNARNIAALQDQPVVAGTPPVEYYISMIGKLGLEANEAKHLAESQQLLVDSATARREAAMSVSLDEEMMNLVRYQHAYQAAARMVTAIDSMIDTLVNRTGLVGR